MQALRGRHGTGQQLLMRIGTIGAGFVARAAATVAIRHGHEVMVSNTRGPERLFSLVRTISCKAGSPKDAAKFGDIVLAAIRLKNYQSIPVEPLEGTIARGRKAESQCDRRCDRQPVGQDDRVRWPAWLCRRKDDQGPYAAYPHRHHRPAGSLLRRF
jgi:hypothetical protein